MNLWRHWFSKIATKKDFCPEFFVASCSLKIQYPRLFQSGFTNLKVFLLITFKKFTYKTPQPRGKNHTSNSKKSRFCICFMISLHISFPSACRQPKFITSIHCFKIQKLESMFKERQQPSRSKSRIRINVWVSEFRTSIVWVIT